jgi:ABC-2 type transport system ATP-binding protein
MSNGENIAIELIKLSKYYGRHRGIDDLSLQIGSGVIYGFLGPNGAGKTTTIRCLLGILKPTEGDIYVFGKKVTQWTSKRKLKEKIGYLPGEFELYKHFTVKQILDYFDSLRKNRPAVLREELVDIFELDESRAVSQLSKGNKQKVGLIQALMHDPELIILDEPTSGLDPLMQQRLYRVLKEFKNRGKTIFFSSHNLSEVQKIADEVAIIKDGYLVTKNRIDALSSQVQQKLLVTTKMPIDASFSTSPLIESLERIGKPNGDNRYLIWIHTHDHMYSEVFKLLERYRVLDVSIPEPSLEEYFIKYYSEG